MELGPRARCKHRRLGSSLGRARSHQHTRSAVADHSNRLRRCSWGLGLSTRRTRESSRRAGHTRDRTAACGAWLRSRSSRTGPRSSRSHCHRSDSGFQARTRCCRSTLRRNTAGERRASERTEAKSPWGAMQASSTCSSRSVPASPTRSAQKNAAAIRHRLCRTDHSVKPDLSPAAGIVAESLNLVRVAALTRACRSARSPGCRHRRAAPCAACGRVQPPRTARALRACAPRVPARARRTRA
jgi:hypothetical protein